jgi:hypothetical protein
LSADADEGANITQTALHVAANKTKRLMASMPLFVSSIYEES